MFWNRGQCLRVVVYFVLASYNVTLLCCRITCRTTEYHCNQKLPWCNFSNWLRMWNLSTHLYECTQQLLIDYWGFCLNYFTYFAHMILHWIWNKEIYALCLHLRHFVVQYSKTSINRFMTSLIWSRDVNDDGDESFYYKIYNNTSKTPTCKCNWCQATLLQHKKQFHSIKIKC